MYYLQYLESYRAITLKYWGDIASTREGRYIVCKNKRSSWDLIGFSNGIISRQSYLHTIHLHKRHFVTQNFKSIVGFTVT